MYYIYIIDEIKRLYIFYEILFMSVFSIVLLNQVIYDTKNLQMMLEYRATLIILNENNGMLYKWRLVNFIFKKILDCKDEKLLLYHELIL